MALTHWIDGQAFLDQSSTGDLVYWFDGRAYLAGGAPPGPEVSGAFTMAGSSTAAFVGEQIGGGVTEEGAFAGAGDAAAAFGAAIIIPAAFSMPGGSSFTPVIEDAAFTNATFNLPGTSTAAFAGEALAASDFNAPGTSDAAFVGESIHEAAFSMAGGSSMVAQAKVLLASIGAEVGGSVDFEYVPVIRPEADFNPRRLPAIQINDQLNDAPDSLTYVEDEVEPHIGQHVTVDFNDGSGVLFEGPIQIVSQEFDELPENIKWAVTATDYKWFLNRKRPFARWTRVSATTVVTELMAQFASSDFTVTNVQADLPEVTVKFDGSQELSSCLTTIANLIGGHWYLDVKDLHFYVDEVTEDPDDIVDGSPTLLANPPITVQHDATQLRTRVWVKGAGTVVARDHEPGETELEVESNAMFETTGGWALVASSQRIRYTGKREGVIEDPLPEESVPQLGPGTAMTLISSGVSAGYSRGDTYETLGFYCTFIYADGSESDYGPMSNLHAFGPGVISLPTLSSIPLGAPTNGQPCVARKIYQFRPNKPEQVFPWYFISDNSTTQVVAMQRMYTTGVKNKRVAPPPAAPNAVVASASGEDGETIKGDKYTVNDAPDGVITYAIAAVYRDGTESVPSNPLAPVSLNDEYPRFDPMPSAPTLNDVPVRYYKVYRVDTGSPFLAGIIGPGLGGWLDNVLLPLGVGGAPRTSATPVMPTSSIHYWLTGIPSAGDGSIQHPIVTDEVLNDSAVRILVQVDDVEAQAELAQAEGGDGVHESHLDSDYPNVAAATAAGLAELAQYARPIVTVRYATRDRKTRAGKTVNINLTQPPIVATLKIQNVTIDQIHETSDLVERYNVTASSVRFTFEDLLRRVELK